MSPYSTGFPGDYNFSAKEIVFLGHKVGGDAAAELGSTDIKGKAVLLVNDGETRAAITRRLAFIQSKNPSIIITTTATQPNANGGAGGQRGGGQRGGGAGFTPRPTLSIKPDKQPVTMASGIQYYARSCQSTVHQFGRNIRNLQSIRRCKWHAGQPNLYG